MRPPAVVVPPSCASSSLATYGELQKTCEEFLSALGRVAVNRFVCRGRYLLIGALFDANAVFSVRTNKRMRSRYRLLSKGDADLWPTNVRTEFKLFAVANIAALLAPNGTRFAARKS